MKINRVESEQFAGIQNKEIDFENGLNLIVGENESGKSTMVDLIYHMLFTETKLRKGSDFNEKYFPKKVSGPEGNIINGVLVFETKNGKYKLKKEWDKGKGSCRLWLPDGTLIEGIKETGEILEKELEHRAGVYNEIVFASQKRQQVAVESIMSALSKKTNNLTATREDLNSTLIQAALETGGVSLNEIEKKLENILQNYINHWDFESDMPQRDARGTKKDIENKWQANEDTSKILDAYYKMKEVEKRLKDTEDIERAIDSINDEIQNIKSSKKLDEKKKNELQKVSGILETRMLTKKAIENKNSELDKQKEALKDWPILKENIAKAEELQKKEKLARIHDLFLKVKEPQQKYEEAKKNLKELRSVDQSDLSQAKEYASDKKDAENKLAGLNLVAKIKQLGTIPIEVKAISTDSILATQDGELNIKEAVEVSVPGIMEMQLMPQGVNVSEIKKIVLENKTKIKDILEKYGANSLECLMEMEKEYREAESEVVKKEGIVGKLLGEKQWERLKEENRDIPSEIETEAEIISKIRELCGNRSIDNYIGAIEGSLSRYEGEYTSIEKLASDIKENQREIEKYQNDLNEKNTIPEKFQDIKDPKEYEKKLSQNIEEYEKKIDSKREDLSARERQLDEKTAEEYQEEFIENQDRFEALKKEYVHWNHIFTVYSQLNGQISGSPMEDIENKFREYLDVLTVGGLSLTSIDEKMSVQLASGSWALTYDILSEGTKDTISLAFRLAMLEHIFPNGDGIALFDDPFTDMDPKRVEQACMLIQKYAENNQVIFITCDDKYKGLLSGKTIAISK